MNRVYYAYREHVYEDLVVEHADAVVMCQFLVVHEDLVVHADAADEPEGLSEDADVEIMVGDVACWVLGPGGGRTISTWNFGHAKSISYLVEGGRTRSGCRGSRVRYWVAAFSAC